MFKYKSSTLEPRAKWRAIAELVPGRTDKECIRCAARRARRTGRAPSPAHVAGNCDSRPELGAERVRLGWVGGGQACQGHQGPAGQEVSPGPQAEAGPVPCAAVALYLLCADSN